MSDVRKLAELTPTEWAKAMSDKELIERMQGWLGSAELPKAVGDEVKRRYNARKYGPRIR